MIFLGETFRCHWKLTDEKEPTSQEEALTHDSPLPWCKSDDLIFVAEQVSHHPPISAFYTEHIKKRISVNAHIYTKSSFLGMSVSCPLFFQILSFLRCTIFWDYKYSSQLY